MEIAAASLAVFVDAAADADPGEIVVRRIGPGGRAPDAAAAETAAADAASAADAGTSSPRAAEPGASSHHVGVEELVALARELFGGAPEIVTVGVGVASLGLGETLSPMVAAALPAVVDTVAEIVETHRREVG